MKSTKFFVLLLFMVIIFAGVGVNSVNAQLKVAYVNSNKVLETYKEAIDVKKQLQDLNVQWENQAKGMQEEVQELQDQLESQSLLLSDERKQAKQREIQTLYLKYQQFLQQKWNPQGGEAMQKEVELLQPIFDKINTAITKIGKADGYSYIFDAINSNILYAGPEQEDLTERLLEELNKGLPEQAKSSKKEEN